MGYSDFQIRIFPLALGLVAKRASQVRLRFLTIATI